MYDYKKRLMILISNLVYLIINRIKIKKYGVTGS